MRFATYNVEWFDALFADDDTLLDDGEWSRRYDVTRANQLAALGVVFSAMDADVITVVEAPDTNKRRDTVTALERFAEAFKLRARKALIGFQNHTQQEIALLYDPDVIAASHDPKSNDNAPSFDGHFAMDLDTDNDQDQVVFSKPPLEAALRTVSGADIQLMGVHVKSKAPHGAKNRADEISISIENRRKQLAQCIWLRRRTEALLSAGQSVMVMGDFNDGPGLDEYERLFGRSGVEIVMGEAGEQCLFDPHATRGLKTRLGGLPTTSRFYISHEDRYLSALLDYIMISADLREKSPSWRIWHPFDDRKIYQNQLLREALLTASDHFPVVMDIDL